MSVLEWLVIVELAVCFVMGAMWLLARKPDANQEGERAYRVSRAFWKVVLGRERTFAGEGLEAEKLVAGAGDATPEVKAETIPVAVLNIVVTEESSCDQIVGFEKDEVRMLVQGPAGAGGANRAVLQLLTEVLELQPFQVQMERWHYSDRKIVRVSGLDRAGVGKKLGKIL